MRHLRRKVVFGCQKKYLVAVAEAEVKHQASNLRQYTRPDLMPRLDFFEIEVTKVLQIQKILRFDKIAETSSERCDVYDLN